MELTISVRIKPRAGADLIRGQYRHDLRKGRVPGYVDKTRSNKNSHICLAAGYGERPGALIREFDRRLTAKKKTSRTAEVLVGVVTFSKGAQELVENLPRDGQDKLLQHIVARVAAKMDVPANYVRIHRDESAIHAHFSLLNVTSKGRTYRGGRSDMSKLQDVAAQACQELGYDIKRGKSKAARIKDGEESSKYINRTVRQLHEALPKEIAILESERDALAEKVRAMSERLTEAETKTLEAETKLNERTGRIANLEQKILENERDMENAERKRTALEQKIDALQRQRDDLAENIRVTGDRLAEAERKLEGFQGENQRLEKRIATYSSRLASRERELTELQEKIEVERLTLVGIKAEFKKSVKLPPRPEGRKRFLGSEEEVLIKKSTFDGYAKAIEQQYISMRKKEMELDEILRADFVEQSKYDAVKAERDRFKASVGASNEKLKELDNANFLVRDENKRLRARLSRYEVIESDQRTIRPGKGRENAGGGPGR